MSGMKLLFLSCGVICVFMLIVWKLEEIFDVLFGIKRRIIDIYCGIVDRVPEIQGWNHIVFEQDDNWYCKEKLIAHACGGNIRLSYTNSKEALLQAIQDGFRVVEVDVRFTKDGKLVCTHDFKGTSETPDYRRFMADRIDGRFSPMDFSTCVAIARGKDVSLIVDTKRREELPEVIQWVRSKMPKATKLFVQIFSENELLTVSGIPVLYNLTFTEDYQRVAAFCAKNGIRVVSISSQRMASKEWRILLEHNIKIFVHTVNSLSEYRNLRDDGVAGVFTDFLVLSDIADAEET